MTNKEKASNIVDHIFLSGLNENNTFYNMALNSALKMAEWKDSQPQIIEIFGTRVKIVEDNDSTAKVCMECAFSYECTHWHLGICRTADDKFKNHFVEVDEDGNEIKKEQKQTI